MIKIKDEQMIIDGEKLVVWVDNAEDINNLKVKGTVVQNCEIHVIVTGESDEISK